MFRTAKSIIKSTNNTYYLEVSIICTLDNGLKVQNILSFLYSVFGFVEHHLLTMFYPCFITKLKLNKMDFSDGTRWNMFKIKFRKGGLLAGSLLNKTLINKKKTHILFNI
jgi:hypothetical protein